jgi:sporulation protein YpjB
MHVRKWFLLIALAFVVLASACSKGGDESGRMDGTDPAGPDTETSKAIAEMNVTAENLFKYTREDNPDLARAELNGLAKQLERFHFDGIVSVEGMEALTKTIIEGKKEFNAVSFDRRRALLAAGKIRLAVDALDRSRKAMWLQYNQLFYEDIAELRKALSDSDTKWLKALLDRTKAHYDLIRPAALISREPSEVSALDSLLEAMTERVKSGDIQDMSALVEHYATLIDNLFKPTAPSAQFPLPDVPAADDKRPVLWTTTIGLVIITVLAYAAWLRYRYEMEYGIPVKKRNDEDWPK